MVMQDPTGKPILAYIIILKIENDKTEAEIQQWITSFIAEVDRIETFFKKNLRDLKLEF
jgi:hypothetical protein